MRLATLVLSTVTSVFAAASPAIAAPPEIEDQVFTFTQQEALQAYAADPSDVLADCGTFDVLAAYTVERRVITFADRELRLLTYTGTLFRADDPSTSAPYGGTGHRELVFGSDGPARITINGNSYIVEDGRRIMTRAGYTSFDFTAGVDEPLLTERGLVRDVVCEVLS